MKKQKSGFSLVEVLIVVFIFSAMAVLFYKTYTIGLRNIAQTKSKLGAIALANEKMEIIRNLKYDDVGVQGGIPNGNIPEEENLTKNAKKYHVKSSIRFIDDSLDGSEGSGDAIATDYKIAKVTVSWTNSDGSTGSVSTTSRFVPPGLETTSGDGTLAINVVDSTGVGIPNTSVHITNTLLSPNVNLTMNTDLDGHLLLPGAKQSIEGYHITVSKSGYETVATMDPDPAVTGYTPVYAYISVLPAMLNTYNCVQDKLSTLTVKSEDLTGTAVANMPFTIYGGKILGKDISLQDVYSMSLTSETTGADGEKKFADISPGQYTVVEGSDPNYEFINFDPVDKPYALATGVDTELIMRFASKTQGGIAVKVVDNASGNAIENASVELSNGAGFSNTQTSGSDGIVFFPNKDDSNPLAAGLYDLHVTASGYSDYDASPQINIGTTLINEAVPMNAS